MEKESKLIVVVGLGEIGRPLYELIAAGHDKVRGVDIEPVAINESVGIMHVCFPYVEPQEFIATAVSYAAKYKPEIIVVNSTVQPGTTRAIEKGAKVPVVFSPVRGKHTRMKEDLHVYKKLVAGTDEQAVQRVCRHFEKAGFKTDVLSNPEGLELAKLLETTYFGLLIAWAQEAERLAGEVNADYFEVAKIFEEIPYLPPVIFVPGYIGGHCVMPNIRILQRQFKSDFLDAITRSNERKAGEKAQAEGKGRKRVDPISVKDRPTR